MSRECSIDDCSKQVSKRGLCAMHHWRLIHKGNPTAPVTQPLTSIHEAALRYVDRCQWVGDCLVLRDNAKYGEVSWGPKKQRTRMTAHRAVYITFNGPLAEDQVARHRCDNPPCVNPAHLQAGSVADNSRDMYDRARRVGVRAGGRGEDNPSAVMTAEVVAELRIAAATGLSLRGLAISHGLKYTAVRSAVRGVTWSHITDPAPLPNVRIGRPSPTRRLAATHAEQCARAAALAADGRSLSEIAAEIGVSRSTAYKLTHALEAS